jgi:outer membrane protein OmpA-like peptidoglycan-associated protein
MHSRTATALLLASGLITGTAYSQVLPSGQSGTASREQLPVFRVTVVGRTTPAINYRPRRGSTEIDFVGTSLMPRARGRANVEGNKGAIEVDASFDKLEPASRFGSEYLTYVVWAITPEGRPTNLGELQVDGDDGKLKATTELQAFGLVVTAEPYFAVTQPSDVVVMENQVRDNTVGNIEVVQVKYDLLKRGSYLMNQQGRERKLKAIEPGVRLDLAEAANAVRLAELAGADRYAPDTFRKAEQLLAEAQRARERRARNDAVMMPARQAVQTAEDARLIALRRQEEAFAADERAQLRQRESIAIERARTEEARRELAEREKIAADRERAAAQAARAEAEAARSLAESRAEQARAAAEREKAEAELARAAAERQRAEADTARSVAESARSAAAAQADQAHAAAAQAEREKAELREQLREQLNVILETRETARGLIVNLSDVLFDTDSANLKPGAREKIAKVTGILLAHPGLEIDVVGHTDSVGRDDYNQALSERRAESVRAYLVQQGMPPRAVGTSGVGESLPVAGNETAAGRQQNRRVELIVSGEPIAIATTARRR